MANQPTFTVLNQEAPQGGRCWSCGDMRAAHFCTSCGKVQPSAPTDYFAFFGLPRKLALDTQALEREFYALSRKLHPDLAARNAEQEQRWSLEKSSQLNDAYRTLKDPIARTRYLLELEGVKVEEQSSSATKRAREAGEAKQQVVPPELLEEVFELNMQLQELRMNRQIGEDDPDILRELGGAKRRFEERMDVLAAELEGYWAEWDAAGESVPAEARAKMLASMVDLLNRRSYIRNLVRDVNDALAD